MIHKKIDLQGIKLQPVELLHTFGGENGRESYAVTNRYLMRNGRAFFPVMGEFHYSRYPADYWEESLLKMKAGGIQVVSTYVFWNHHEEERGKFDWSGNKDLRRFLSLCAKAELRVLLRIGPWVHGESRYGGFPDWLIHLNIPLRENDGRYLELVRTFYGEIYQQAKGLLFSDGGPVVGIQIENEYGHCGGLCGEPGKEHIRMLKKIALEVGFQVPFYTTTGWGNGVVVEGETLPVLGGYAEAPWEQHIREREASPGYLFRPVHTHTDIGTDLAQGKEEQYSYDVTRYPYFTAELGGGLEPTHHRRPIISADDTGAMAMAYLGSGAALLGYYMYHGGTNPKGRFTTLQESKEAGSPNDYPELSYDFQAPINEYGQLNDSYGRLKAIHMFLQDFGEEMAESVCFFPKDNPQDAEDMKDLRYSVRYGEKGGFLFLNNYQRRRKMTDKTGICINISADSGIYRFENINLMNGDYFFFPFHLNLGGLKLLSAEAQLLCSVNTPDGRTYVFFCNDGETPCYRFQSNCIRKVVSDCADYKESGGAFEIKIRRGAQNKAFSILLKSGETIKILTISRKEAYNAWKVRGGEGETLLIANACMYREDNTLHLVSTNRKIRILAYPGMPKAVKIQGASCSRTGGNGSFSEYLFQYSKADRNPKIRGIQQQKSDDGIVSEFQIERSKGCNIDDDILTVRFNGDCARLLIGGKLSADWFYNGNDWKIGLKRFGNLNQKTIQIKIDALHSSDFVFLEKKPEFQGGIACSIKEISIAPVYHAKLEWKGTS